MKPSDIGNDFWGAYGFLRSHGWSVEGAQFGACIFYLNWRPVYPLQSTTNSSLWWSGFSA